MKTVPHATNKKSKTQKIFHLIVKFLLYISSFYFFKAQKDRRKIEGNKKFLLLISLIFNLKLLPCLVLCLAVKKYEKLNFLPLFQVIVLVAYYLIRDILKRNFTNKKKKDESSKWKV